MTRRWARLQLGRLSESLIGIVAVTRTDVFVLRIELDNCVEIHGFLKVKRDENETGDELGVLSVVCREGPEVMRFEWDVPLWVNGRMVVWQINGDARLHTMPELTRRPGSIRDMVPYVHTKRAAGDFTVAVFEEEGV
ncbi:uncharacterized protein A4U43_C03F28110 [Asparagus officinalis]|uniref:Uncharacterized protein n=1 Tax=Asparagus officinalis TaxID=4686 RepID=A0A5P1FHT8_ASPOF|nr:uncharacterized protein A4U43_C03F28110 [Asparagus officinalis]